MLKSSKEYSQFLEEYNTFLQHYTYASELCVVVKTSKQHNTQVALLYEKALQEHINATNAFIGAIAVYKQLVTKWLLVAHSTEK
jgi:hypothetical protein